MASCSDPPATVVPAEPYLDGRDELNLADFPISVLQRQQPQDGLRSEARPGRL